MSKEGQPSSYPSAAYPPQQQPPQYQQQYQQQYPQQQQPAVATVVVSQPAVAFRQYPVAMQCPHCRNQISTEVHYETGILPWLACGGIALFGFVLGCCLIPFCIDSLKDAIHKCPNCHKVVGHFKHI